jgi:hypothetical protein
MNKAEYYVKFKNEEGKIRKKYIQAKNCSQAVRTAKVKYGAKSIIKSGKARNERGYYRRLLGF